MLYIEDIKYYLPSTQVPIHEMKAKANISHDMANIFVKIYGLQKVLVASDVSIFDMLSHAVADILYSSNVALDKINYLIHTHTGSLVIPFGSSLPQSIKERFQLTNAIAFGTTMHKCVSAFKAFEILSVLLCSSEKSYALLMTGEISFTPELRLIPRSSISGDAAAVALVSNDSNNHQLLAVQTTLLSGYSEGIYLTDEKLQQFDAQFIQVITNTILTALKKANIELNSISLILPHNVNFHTWRNIAKSLKMPVERIYLDNIPYFGHCFSSDGLLNLALAIKNGRLKKYDYYLMAGCGMGFFFSCAVFRY